MMPGAPPPPTTINVPPAYHHQQPQTGGGKRNYNDNNHGGQRRRPNNYRGNRNVGGDRRDRRNSNNTQKAYSNSLKQNLNLLYCFLCGYDVDDDVYNCPTNCQKQVHLPHIKRDDAHMYEGACMKAQHKTKRPFSMFFVMIHPWPAPVPSGIVLCCAFMHAPSYMWASSLLT